MEESWPTALTGGPARSTYKTTRSTSRSPSKPKTNKSGICPNYSKAWRDKVRTNKPCWLIQNCISLPCIVALLLGGVSCATMQDRDVTPCDQWVWVMGNEMTADAKVQLTFYLDGKRLKSLSIPLQKNEKGCRTRTRTLASRFRVCCATITPSGNKRFVSERQTQGVVKKLADKITIPT